MVSKKRLDAAVEQMARIMCKAEGWDPDVKVLPYKTQAVAARGHPIAGPGIPSWMLYEYAALRVIEKLKIMEKTYALEVIRDADEDCGKDGLPHNLPPMIRAMVDKALEK